MDNPYYNQEFFSFLAIFFQRIPFWMQLGFGRTPLAVDEIQILVLALLGISSALIGSFLVFKKMTMLANSISHTILLGIIPAFLLSATVELNLLWLLSASLIAAMLTAFFTQAIHRWTRLQEDASTGIVFTTLFALGIILATLLTRNAHIGAEAVMGNADALDVHDIRTAFSIFLLTLASTALFFRKWQMIAFDPVFARLLGYNVSLQNYLLLFLASIVLVGAFRAVGVLMVLTFITAPALLARLFCKSLGKLLFAAMGIALICSVTGVAFARHLLTRYDLALSTGALVVTLLGALYAGMILIIALFMRRFDFFRSSE